jgi:Ca2+-binding RTX toxin-like protein
LIYSCVSLTIGANIERISLTGSSAIDAAGTADANSLFGTSNSAANVLMGLGGNDMYYLGISDVADESVASSSGVDTIYTAFTFSLADTAHVKGTIERLTLTGTAAINGTGNALAGNIITGNSGANVLDGGADAVVDTLVGGLGNDIYIIKAGIDAITEIAGQGTADRVRTSVNFTLSAGDDIEILETSDPASAIALNLTGNETRQTIVGNAGANVLSGGAENDTLSSAAGNDRLNGGIGLDYLNGGAGSDTFVFNTALNTATNRDTVADFSAALDTMQLENTGTGLFNTLTTGTLNAAFFKANATGVATDADDRIVYNTATGALYYDSNGSAGGATNAIQFATLSTKPVLTNADFVII